MVLRIARYAQVNMKIHVENDIFVLKYIFLAIDTRSPKTWGLLLGMG